MQKTLFLFRDDLRLEDNPGYFAACEKGKVLPVYILDDLAPKVYAKGAASMLWLHHSLLDLKKSLENHLHIDKGDPEEILISLIEKEKIDAVYMSASFAPWYRSFDGKIEKILKKKGTEFSLFNSSYLRHPEEVVKDCGKPFSVFSPFKRKSYKFSVRKPFPKPKEPHWIKSKGSLQVDDLALLPTRPWGKTVASHWEFGEKAAHKKLNVFLKRGLHGYKKGRDFPALEHTSRLSPHLAFGEISPFQIWHAVEKADAPEKDVEHFLSEITWREFSYYLLYHYPPLPEKNFQKKFDRFPWQTHTKLLSAWEKGETGYPIIDAGMRQLWQTGYLHNRLRMTVGSFLVKNLLIHWHKGRDWFWDTLVDADIANNSAGWQWIAGSGADAAPYFRIFSPKSQVERFDPEGEYIRHFLPELKDLPQKYLAEPWQAPEDVLRKAGVCLGKNYPEPIIDIQESRKKALAAFQSIGKTT